MKDLRLKILRDRLGLFTRPSPTVRSPVRLLSRRAILLAALGILALTGTIGYRYYNEPQLTIGRRSPQTIRAPQTVVVEDKVATTAARNAARQSALNVFTPNTSLTETVATDFNHLLTQVQALRKLAGPLPFVPDSQLSLPTQQYLRRLNPSDLNALLQQAKTVTPKTVPAISDAFPTLQQAGQELNTLYRTLSPTQWQPLSRTVLRANEQYHFAKRSVTAQLSTLEIEPVLDVPDREWEKLSTQLQRVLHRMLAQGIAPGLRTEVIRHAVTVQVSDWNAPHQQVAVQLLPVVLRSNLVIDPVETLHQQERAAGEVSPVQVQVREGEVIVWQNQTITSAHFALLDHLALSQRRVNGEGLWMTGVGVAASFAIFTWFNRRYYQRWSHQHWTHRDSLLVLLLTLSAPLMVGLTEVTYTTLPAVGLLMGSFYGSVMGGVVVGLLTLVMPLGLPEKAGATFMAIACGSLVGSLMAGHARSREELARIGLILGVVQTVAYGFFLGGTGFSSPLGLGVAALRQGVIGVGWCIVALGVSPYLEKLFDLITPIRLAELANPNRPLLKQLAEKAPGTFQHTQFVTTLAEAGARALNCNIELVRTGTLYHDIGKLHDPQAFIENQFGGPNKHTELNNPWQSAHLIRQHVEQGLVMARKAGLPSAVQAFIPEHQGTMLIAYFYHQATQLTQQSPESLILREEDFRYEGPIPQSRETGIVMLADSCEAALRSMKQKAPEAVLRTVKQIFKSRWEDQQLVAAQLSRADLETLAQTFVQVWQQVNHERIAYPPPLPFKPCPKVSKRG